MRPKKIKYNETYQILETGTDIISAHLRWVIRNAAVSHCGVSLNMIAYHEDLPTNNFGEAVPILQGIAINLSKHFHGALDAVVEEQNMWMSIRSLIIRELIDTSLHEAHHLKAARENNIYNNPDIEHAEAEAVGKTAFMFGKRWDVDVFDFGPVINELLEDFINSLKEDLQDKMVMWKAMQVYMWDNKLAYFDGDTGIEYNMRQLFEAHAKNMPEYSSTDWSDEPMKFKGDPGVKKVASGGEPTATLSAQVSQPTPTPIVEIATPIAAASLPSSISDEDDMDWPAPEPMEEEPYEVVGTIMTPVAAAPLAYANADVPVHSLSTAEMAECAEHVQRLLFWHIQNKCEFNAEGCYNNPGAVLEPISIAHIKNATTLFTHFNTTNAQGKFVNNAPIVDGLIKGIVTGTNLPSYQLIFSYNGSLHKRSFLPVNGAKRDSNGNLTNWATQAREGWKRIMWFEHKGSAMIKRAHIELAPGSMLGQEDYKIQEQK